MCIWLLKKLQSVAKKQKTLSEKNVPKGSFLYLHICSRSNKIAAWITELGYARGAAHFLLGGASTFDQTNEQETQQPTDVQPSTKEHILFLENDHDNHHTILLDNNEGNNDNNNKENATTRVFWRTSYCNWGIFVGMNSNLQRLAWIIRCCHPPPCHLRTGSNASPTNPFHQIAQGDIIPSGGCRVTMAKSMYNLAVKHHKCPPPPPKNNKDIKEWQASRWVAKMRRMSPKREDCPACLTWRLPWLTMMKKKELHCCVDCCPAGLLFTTKELGIGNTSIRGLAHSFPPFLCFGGKHVSVPAVPAGNSLFQTSKNQTDE